MSAAYTYLLSTGTIAIDTTDLLADVEKEWTAAFGAALDLDSSTPQGTMIAAETVARTSVMKNNADLANTINPNLSYGVFLDAICALMGIERGVNQSTVGSDVIVSGDPSTNIQAGSRVQTSNGDIFVLVNSITIPPSRNIGAVFQSQEYGQIPLPLESLTIIDGTIGWGSATVTPDTVVTPGTDAYTDPQLKNARQQQLAKQGTGSTAAIAAALLNVPNVTSAQIVENNTGVVGTVNGITFTKPNAIWVCVAGTPSSALVAQALYDAHGGGVPWDYGAAGMGVQVNPPDGVTAYDPTTHLPYNVLYTTPILYDTYVHIEVHQPPDASPGENAIANAIMKYANGQEAGEKGFIVSAKVSAFEIAGSVCRQYPGVYVKSCQVACVLKGAAAPVYPAGYVYEFLTPMYGQAQLAIGNIAVSIV